MELPVTPGLRPVVPEHRPDIKQLCRRRIGIHFIFYIRPDGRSRIFGAQRQTAFTSVSKSVHFFFNNVCRFTDTAQKQLGMLKNRRPDFQITILGTNLTHSAFQITPCFHIARQDIFRASRCCGQHIYSSSSAKSRLRLCASCGRLPVYVPISLGILSFLR